MTEERLDERQRAEFSRKMRGRHVTLQREAAAALRDTGDPQHAALAGQVHDLQEQALADVLDDVRLADVRRDLEEMHDIEQALARMHAGGFGQCIDCGVSIGFARLEAYPTAKRCLGCQESYERQRGEIRRPRL